MTRVTHGGADTASPHRGGEAFFRARGAPSAGRDAAATAASAAGDRRGMPG